MIRYRKSSRVRDAVGAVVFAVAIALLWVETSDASPETGSMVFVDGTEVVDNTPSIRAAAPEGLDCL
jgi:hypothetical protein